MKVNIYNTKPCKVTFCAEDDGMYDAPYPFDDLNAALAYCEEEIDVRQQAISAAIWDADTGEVYATCGFDENDIAEEDDPYDLDWDDHYWDDGCPVEDYDADIEMGFNPYLGAYDYDC